MKRFVPFLVCAAMMVTLLGCKEAGNSQTKAAEVTKEPPASDPEKIQPAGTWGKPNELYPVLKGGKWGYVNNTGKMVIEPQYLMAGRFTDDLAMVVDGKKKKVGYIDREGKYVIEPKFDGGGPFAEGFAAYYMNKKAGLIDKTGKTILEPKFHRIGRFHEGLAVAVVATELRDRVVYDCGYIDYKGKVVIIPQFESACTAFSEGLAGIRKLGQLWSFIDTKGNTAIKPAYFALGQFGEGIAAASAENSRWGFIDKSGNWVITPRYEQVGFFSDGRATAIGTGGKLWGYIDKSGGFVVKQQFSFAEPFQDGIALVQVGKKVGYIDRDGKYVWPLTE